jgi:hypothetical protein
MPAVEPARLDRLCQVVHRLDAELMIELESPLGAEAGHPGQLEDAGRDLGAQFVEGRDPAGLAELGDLGRDRGADAGDRPQRLDVETAEVIGPAADGTSRLLVVPDPEHVAAGDDGQFGVLAQEGGDLFVSGGSGGCPPEVSRVHAWQVRGWPPL